jgi:anti-sigma factor RsiW
MSGAERKITEADFVAYADERLEPTERALVEAWLAEHPEDRKMVDAWRGQTAALRTALDPTLAEPLPAAMTAILSRPAPRRQAWLAPALAASLALAIGLGSGLFVGQSGWLFGNPGGDRADIIARAGYRAHKIYTAEVRHPVEVPAAEEDHLVSWLSKRIGAPVKAPDLSSEGLHLLGGRLVPVEGDPAAQMMYEAANGDRYTLFVTKSEGAPPTSFHFEEWGAIGCYYWIDGNLGYALNGPKDKAKLMTIATKIYEQMS